MLRFPSLLFVLAAGLVACGAESPPRAHATAAKAASADGPRPAKLGLCASCHGEDGRPRVMGAALLAGRDTAQLRQALVEYRDGRRTHPTMRAIAGTLGEDDIAALAAWYAGQPARR